MSDTEDARIVEAIEALGGWNCQNCGAEMRDPAYCDACAQLFCPYCRMPTEFECDHLLALWDPDWGFSVSPFAGLSLPRLPECTDGSVPEERSDEELVRAFGDLLPLLVAYDEGGFEAEPEGFGEYLLWDAMKAMLSEQPGARNRFVPDSPGSSPYEDAFFEDPDAARAEIADIVERLGAGFERLAAIGSSRP